MSKKLIAICILVFCLCVIGSFLVNHRTASTVNIVRESPVINSKNTQKNDWIAILEEAPQYKKPDLEQPVVHEVKDIHISDGQIIGIIAGNPNSVLIHIDDLETLEPLQLTEGEGWLPNWQIKQINPDSVVWSNNLNQEIYTQMLFNDKKLAQQKSISKISGIK